MPFFSWSFRRQLGVVGILAFFLFFIVGGAIYFFLPSPTCFDNTQNQDEEGVDCGGEVARCKPCAEQVRDLAAFWTRFFPLGDGRYDIAALVENRNQFYAATRLDYAVKLYDKNNILVAIRNGVTFAEPGERFVIFEPSLTSQNRIPARAILEIREVAWARRDAKPLPINIVRKDFLLAEIPPRVEVKIKNQSSAIYRDLEAAAVLFSGDGEAVGASRTILEEIGILEEANLTFTWPASIFGTESVEIYLRKRR